MKTKIFLIGFAIITIGFLFAVPALRDGEEAERYDGRPFPDRAIQNYRSAQATQPEGQPVIEEPAVADSYTFAVPDVAAPVSSDTSFDAEQLIQAEEDATETFTLNAPDSSDPLLLFDDDSLSSETDEVSLDPSPIEASPTDLGEWSTETVEEPVGMQFDEVAIANENPFDKPIALPMASPFDAPISVDDVIANESGKLPTIETGTGFRPFRVGQSHVEVNPYVVGNSPRLARRELDRPVARPSFDKTPTTPTGKPRPTNNTESMPTSVMVQDQTQAETLPEPLSAESSPLDTSQSFEKPVPVGPISSPLEPVPADVPIESPISPIVESPVTEARPAYSNVAPIQPQYGAPGHGFAQPLRNTANVPSFNRNNPGVDTFSGSSYLQNNWTPSIFNSEGCGGYGCEPNFPNVGCWGDTSSKFSFGGWLSAGYHEADNQLFNNRPDQFALHQGWLFAEKSATSDSPIGFRVDAVYGIDGADTQAFGNEPGSWDYLNGLDFGAYSWAIPQAYLEVAIGELNVRVGHFFTLLGYETVSATDNFFYSHAMTMYNSEPFTHTGVLLNRQIGDFDVYGGWTLGWDSGFDRFGDGGSWLGGFSYDINENAAFSYFSTAGNFGARGDDGYSQSVVLDLTLTEKMKYVLQSDYLRVASTGEDNVGVAQYTSYALSEKISVGSRLEWWKGDVLTGYAPHGGVLPTAGSLSYFATTFGANIRPTDSLVIRPEIRHDWSPAANYDETYFGIDAVWSF